MQSASETRPTRAEINLDNLAFNFHSAKEFIGTDIKYMAVVKADAYGHGSVKISQRLAAEGVDWLGVALPEEGLELRNAGIRLPILCLGGFWPGQERLLIDNDLTPVIYSSEMAEALNAAARKTGRTFTTHIKIDTGMGRIGVRHDAVKRFASEFKHCTNLEVEGLMTHFAVADDLKQNEFTDLQIERLDKAVLIFRENGFSPSIIDLSNSPGAVAHTNARGNMVRLGGILYGLGDDVLPKEVDKPQLRPVMSVRTQISQLKNIPTGETLGYGRTFTTERDSLIATIPIGYEDGYRRAFSNRARVVVNGSYAPVVGRISMDWTIIDVTDLPDCRVGDEVMLIGGSGDCKVTAEDLAKIAGTISYEIACGIGKRVPREFV